MKVPESSGLFECFVLVHGLVWLFDFKSDIFFLPLFRSDISPLLLLFKAVG